jgi:hypothetical protein
VRETAAGGAGGHGDQPPSLAGFALAERRPQSEIYFRYIYFKRVACICALLPGGTVSSRRSEPFLPYRIYCMA